MRRVIILLFAFGLLAAPLKAVDDPSFEQILNTGSLYRNIGPFRAGSWISDIAVPDSPAKAHLYTFYVGARNGGVWKTTNNGTTFEPIFDGKAIGSIGAIAIAPSNSEIIWVGTGDASCTRSAYSGRGVYKS